MLWDKILERALQSNIISTNYQTQHKISIQENFYTDYIDKYFNFWRYFQSVKPNTKITESSVLQKKNIFVFWLNYDQWNMKMKYLFMYFHHNISNLIILDTDLNVVVMCIDVRPLCTISILYYIVGCIQPKRWKTRTELLCLDRSLNQSSTAKQHTVDFGSFVSQKVKIILL